MDKAVIYCVASAHNLCAHLSKDAIIIIGSLALLLIPGGVHQPLALTALAFNMISTDFSRGVQSRAAANGGEPLAADVRTIYIVESAMRLMFFGAGIAYMWR